MLKYFSICALCLLLTSCLNSQPEDGPPLHAYNIDHVSNAKPRLEPLSRRGNDKTYSVLGQTYEVLEHANGFEETGLASWYGRKFHGQATSSGEAYDMFAMTAAHKHLPLPTYVKVTNLDNRKSVVVKVTDRGPFHANRIIDLSYSAAKKLGMMKTGTARVHVKALKPDGNKLPALSSIGDNGYLQVGAFSERANAAKLRRHLQSNIHNAANIIADNSQGSTLYKVRIGPLKGKMIALLQQQLERQGYRASFVQ